MQRNWPWLRTVERPRISSNRLRCSFTRCALTGMVDGDAVTVVPIGTTGAEVDGSSRVGAGARASVVEGMAGGGRWRDLNVGSI